MVKGMLGLMVACLILNQFATAQEECKEDGKKVMKATAEATKSDQFPCIKELKLEQWQCSEDDDEAKVKQHKKEFLIWMSDQPKEDQIAIAECGGKVLLSAFNSVKGELKPECVEMFENKMKIPPTEE